MRENKKANERQTTAVPASPPGLARPRPPPPPRKKKQKKTSERTRHVAYRSGRESHPRRAIGHSPLVHHPLEPRPQDVGFHHLSKGARVPAPRPNTERERSRANRHRRERRQDRQLSAARKTRGLSPWTKDTTKTLAQPSTTRARHFFFVCGR